MDLLLDFSRVGLSSAPWLAGGVQARWN